jgi:hypothetical protein
MPHFPAVRNSHTCCRRNARRRNRCCGLASMLDSQAGNLNCGGGGIPAAARAPSKRLTSCSRCFSVSAAGHHGMSIDCDAGPRQLQPSSVVPARGLVACSRLLQFEHVALQTEASTGGIHRHHSDTTCEPGRRFRMALEYSRKSRIWSSSRPAASRSRSHCCCIVSSRSCGSGQHVRYIAVGAVVRNDDDAAAEDCWTCAA